MIKQSKSVKQLSHIKKDGRPTMVDVGSKKIIQRTAIASGIIRVNKTAITQCEKNQGPKGSVFSVATVAGINAAKHTWELIPLCHNLTLDSVSVDFKVNKGKSEIKCIAKVATYARTGVEMEALTAVHIALLTIYDMCKAVDKKMEVISIKLDKKIKG